MFWPETIHPWFVFCFFFQFSTWPPIPLLLPIYPGNHPALYLGNRLPHLLPPSLPSTFRTSIRSWRRAARCQISFLPCPLFHPLSLHHLTPIHSAALTMTQTSRKASVPARRNTPEEKQQRRRDKTRVEVMRKKGTGRSVFLVFFHLIKCDLFIIYLEWMDFWRTPWIELWATERKCKRSSVYMLILCALFLPLRISKGITGHIKRIEDKTSDSFPLKNMKIEKCDSFYFAITHKNNETGRPP